MGGDWWLMIDAWSWMFDHGWLMLDNWWFVIDIIFLAPWRCRTKPKSSLSPSSTGTAIGSLASRSKKPCSGSNRNQAGPLTSFWRSWASWRCRIVPSTKTCSTLLRFCHWRIRIWVAMTICWTRRGKDVFTVFLPMSKAMRHVFFVLFSFFGET